MADNLMYIPNDDTQNYPSCRLQLVDETLGHSSNEQTTKNEIKSRIINLPHPHFTTTSLKPLFRDVADSKVLILSRLRDFYNIFHIFISILY